MNEFAKRRIQHLAPQPSSLRIGSVDVCKLIAIFTVICLHTRPFGLARPIDHSAQWNLLNIFLVQSARFAVPFFFTISGYFWGQKIRNGVPVAVASIPMATRISAIFAFWCAVYLLPYDVMTIPAFGMLGPIHVSYGKLLVIVHHPFRFLIGGDAVHLWFLPALLCSLGIAAFFVARKEYQLLMICSYVLTPIGFHLSLGHFDFSLTRFGPFFGTIFFASGYFLSGLTPRKDWFWWGLGLLAIGFAVQESEVYLLWRIYSADIDHDYVVGTYAMGLGATLVALSEYRFLNNKLMKRCGRYTLGIYCVHMIFVELLGPLAEHMHSPLGEVTYPVSVLALSLVSVFLLAKFSFTRRLVQ
jgi:surface polysaccharide O-acyltransferase-like enzyme